MPVADISTVVGVPVDSRRYARNGHQRTRDGTRLMRIRAPLASRRMTATPTWRVAPTTNQPIAGGSASAVRVLLINEVARVRFVVEDEHRRHPAGDRAVRGADLGVDRDQQGGEAAERHVRALAVLEPRDDRLIDPGQVLDLALGQARVHARGPDLAPDQDQRVVRRAMVALSGRIDAKPLLQESLVHAAIQADRAYPAINRCFTGAHHAKPGSTCPQPGSTCPQPGSTCPQPGSTCPQPGSTCPQPGSTCPQPGSTCPQRAYGAQNSCRPYASARKGQHH